MYRSLLRASALLLCSLGSVYLSEAQQQFEVVSVQAMLPGPNETSITILPGGRFTATRVTVRRLIRWAYQLEDFQIVKSPNPTKEMDATLAESYEIVAKADGNPTPQQMKLFVQGVLKDRFKLEMHREPREMAVYTLVVDSAGPKEP